MQHVIRQRDKDWIKKFFSNFYLTDTSTVIQGPVLIPLNLIDILLITLRYQDLTLPGLWTRPLQLWEKLNPFPYSSGGMERHVSCFLFG